VEVSWQWVCCAESFGALLLFHDKSCFTMCKCIDAKQNLFRHRCSSSQNGQYKQMENTLKPVCFPTVCEQQIMFTKENTGFNKILNAELNSIEVALIPHV